MTTGVTAAVAGEAAAQTNQPDQFGRWDRRLLSLGGHFLQSEGWGLFKQRYGWAVEQVELSDPSSDVRGLAQVLFRKRGPVSVAYVPRGPVLGGDPGQALKQLLDAIERVCRRHRTLTLILELDQPYVSDETLGAFGLVRGAPAIQPERTVKVHLADDEALLKQMHQKTRYNIRLAQRRHVGVLRAVPDQQAIDVFYRLLQDTSERNVFEVHTRAYYEDFLGIFGDRACLLFANVEGQIAASLIAVAFGDEAIYMYGGSSTEHRAHGAAFLLQYEAMKWARGMGCKRYDLWGIPAVDPESIEANQGRVAGTQGDDWRGLYVFKTRFGGEIVRYPGAFERQYHPILTAAARRVASIGG